MMMYFKIEDVLAEKEGLSTEMVKTFMTSFKSYSFVTLLTFC